MHSDLARYVESFKPGQIPPLENFNRIVDFINDASRKSFGSRQLRDSQGVASGGILQKRGEIVLRGEREVVGMGSGPSLVSAVNSNSYLIRRFVRGEILTEERLREMHSAIRRLFISAVTPAGMIQRPVPLVCGSGGYWITPSEFVATGHYRIWASSDHKEVFPGSGPFQWFENLFLNAHLHWGFSPPPGSYTGTVSLIDSNASPLLSATLTINVEQDVLTWKLNSSGASSGSGKVKSFNGVEMKWNAVDTLFAVYVYVVSGEFDAL